MRWLFMVWICCLPVIAQAQPRADRNFIIPLPVDINTADELTLMRALEGIGQKKAQAIIAYRTEHGRFNSVEELDSVKGIGPAIMQRNRERICVCQSAVP